MGLEGADDCAVYKLSEDTALVHTLDFFTPIVDDPYHFGAIAAANSTSDVYAMGGEVLCALNICGFPSSLPESIVAEILRGGAEKVREAGAVLVGGHTIDSPEPFYGLAVAGVVHPQRILTKEGAREGDVLVLTKPIGGGVITTALKAEEARAEDVQEVVGWMTQLNNIAGSLFSKLGVRACTDVTGYALVGHAVDLAQKSNCRLHIDLNRVPVMSGARRYAEASLFPGGTYNNRRGYKRHVEVQGELPEEEELLLYTPETSGGLLGACPPEKVDELLSGFEQAGRKAWVIGTVRQGTGVVLEK